MGEHVIVDDWTSISKDGSMWDCGHQSNVVGRKVWKERKKVPLDGRMAGELESDSSLRMSSSHFLNFPWRTRKQNEKRPSRDLNPSLPADNGGC